jgi:hypothetical protein
MSTAAMKMALEALKSISEMVDYEGNGFKLEYEIKALEEALAKQEQGEPLDLASAIEYADARWAGVDVPVEWLRHFVDGLLKEKNTTP